MHRVMHRLNDAWAYSADNPLHSETFLKHVVKMHGLAATDTDLVFERVRGNGFLQKNLARAGAWATGSLAVGLS